MPLSRSVPWLVCCAGGVMLGQAADAATASGTMPVTAIVASSCTVTALPLVFGQLALSGGSNDSQTSVTLICTPGVSYNVGLDAGAHASGTARRMTSAIGANIIPYAIYSDAARSTEWGNVIGSNTVSGTAVAATTVLTAYGRIPAPSSLFAAGLYSDAVTVTVTF